MGFFDNAGLFCKSTNLLDTSQREGTSGTAFCTISGMYVRNYVCGYVIPWGDPPVTIVLNYVIIMAISISRICIDPMHGYTVVGYLGSNEPHILNDAWVRCKSGCGLHGKNYWPPLCEFWSRLNGRGMNVHA